MSLALNRYLRTACKKHDLVGVKKYINRGADVNFVWISSYGIVKNIIGLLINKKYDNIIKYLIDYKHINICRVVAEFCSYTMKYTATSECITEYIQRLKYICDFDISEQIRDNFSSALYQSLIFNILGSIGDNDERFKVMLNLICKFRFNIHDTRIVVRLNPQAFNPANGNGITYQAHLSQSTFTMFFGHIFPRDYNNLKILRLYMILDDKDNF